MKSGRFRAVLSGLVLLLVGGLFGCSDRPAAPSGATGRPKVRLALNWFPEAEHGGYYAALVHGYYRAAGLEVEILPGGPDAPVLPRLASGAVEFCVANADDLLFGRAQEAPVVAVMAPIQDSPRSIMVHQESGITRLEDLRDLTLAMSAKGAFSHYLRRHVALTNVTIVPYGGSVAPFLHNPRYAQQAYLFSEPFVAQQQGARPRCLLLSDIGFNPYTSLLVTTDRLVQENPDLVRRVVTASVRGWETYFADPASTHAHLSQINPEMNAQILGFGVDALRPLARPLAGQPFGAMTRDRWQQLIGQLEKLDLIPQGAVTADAAFRGMFVASPP